jgi:hypothetical protein
MSPQFRVRPMTAADAHAVAAWRYPGEYSFYNADAELARADADAGGAPNTLDGSLLQR